MVETVAAGMNLGRADTVIVASGSDARAYWEVRFRVAIGYCVSGFVAPKEASAAGAESCDIEAGIDYAVTGSGREHQLVYGLTSPEAIKVVVFLDGEPTAESVAVVVTGHPSIRAFGVFPGRPGSVTRVEAVDASGEVVATRDAADRA